MDYERRVLEEFKKKGKTLPFLEEHVALGLPTPEFLEEIAKDYKADLYYSGDLELTERLFRLHNLELLSGGMSQIIYGGKLLLNLVLNTTLMPFITNKSKREDANRFYLVIKVASV